MTAGRNRFLIPAMPATIYALRGPAPGVLMKIKFAMPMKRPRGYFNALLEPTRILLDRNFSLAAAADFLIQNNTLPRRDRDAFLATMYHRFTRLRKNVIEPDAKLEWKASLGYDALHAVSGVKALCGSTAGRWFAGGEDVRKCNRCKAIIRKENLTIHR